MTSLKDVAVTPGAVVDAVNRGVDDSQTRSCGAGMRLCGHEAQRVGRGQ